MAACAPIPAAAEFIAVILSCAMAPDLATTAWTAGSLTLATSSDCRASQPSDSSPGRWAAASAADFDDWRSPCIVAGVWPKPDDIPQHHATSSQRRIDSLPAAKAPPIVLPPTSYA